MARPKNSNEPAHVRLATTPQVCALLDRLVETGLFGKTRAEVAEQLMRDRLREVIERDWPGRLSTSSGSTKGAKR